MEIAGRGKREGKALKWQQICNARNCKETGKLGALGEGRRGGHGVLGR